MEFFKKRSTAYAVLCISIVISIFIGQARKSNSTVVKTPESVTIPGNYIEDNANVLSDSTEKYITERINSLVNESGNAEIQILTVNTANGVDLYDLAINQAEKVNLSPYSAVMVFAIDDIAAQIVVGGEIEYFFTDDDLSYILNNNLTVGMFESKEIENGVKRVLDDVITMYEDYYRITVSRDTNVILSTGTNSTNSYSGNSSLLVLVMVLVILIMILVVFSRPRRVRTTSTARPFYMGGFTPNTYRSNRNTTSSYSGGSRSGGFSSSSRGGSFDGSSRSGGFSSSSRGGSFGGSRGGSFRK